MLKLYYLPHSCSMSSHIVLEESKVPFEAIRVNRDPQDPVKATLLKLNPLGTAPTLVLEDGRVLTQNIAIMEYIADSKPGAALLAPAGSYERVDILRWVSFVAADLHKAYGLLFQIERISQNAQVQDEVRAYAHQQIAKYLTVVENHLAGKKFLVADRFTVADAYLFTVYSWSDYVKVSTTAYPQLNDYQRRLLERPTIKAVLNREEK